MLFRYKYISQDVEVILNSSLGQQESIQEKLYWIKVHEKERLADMKKQALALFMAVILALQLTGCNARKADGNITASNRTQSSIKELFNSARKDKEDLEKTVIDEKELQDEELADKTLDEEKTDKEEDVRYQDDYYEYVNQNLLSKIELSATDAH